jgi:hypothetical protein
MRTNNISSSATKQDFSSNSSSKTSITREMLIERDRLNKERYRLAQFEQVAEVQAPKGLDTTLKLHAKWVKLPRCAKIILDLLDSRSEKWASQPFSQQWLAKDAGYTDRWVRYCINLLKKQGFIAVIPINNGKPFKTVDGWWTYPNIYIVTPFLRWAESTKLYSVIVAKAAKIATDFLQLSNMLKEYIKRENKFVNPVPKSKRTIASFLKTKVLLQF